jgi:hypothetical protein
MQVAANPIQQQMVAADLSLDQSSGLNMSRVNPLENDESFVEEMKELVEMPSNPPPVLEDQ